MPEERANPRRAEILDHLRAAGEPLGVADLAERLGVHPNTVRFHLDALLADGRIEQSVRPPAGPGRPRTVYAPHAGMDRGGARGYRLLARILLSNLAAQGAEENEASAVNAGRAASDPSAAAADAGRSWGRFLVKAPPHRRAGAPESARRLTALLAELDFAPAPDDPDEHGTPRRIRLRHCPFLELAEEYGSVVCPLHLGLMQGALAELGTPLTALSLEPFAEPDACVARLGVAGERH